MWTIEVQQDCTVCVQNCSLHCSCSGVAFHTTGKRVCLPVVWEGSASAGDWTSPPSSQSQSSKRQSYLDFGVKSQIPEGGAYPEGKTFYFFFITTAWLGVFFTYTYMRNMRFLVLEGLAYFSQSSLIRADRKQRPWQVTDYNKGKYLLECLAFTNLQTQIDLNLSISCN